MSTKPQQPTFVLLTDFGSQDEYVGVLKGVITGLSPDARILDLCHDIRPGDIRRAAIMLADNHLYFPKGSYFVVVVDPGVGSKRKALAVFYDGRYFIGPDNGVLSVLVSQPKRDGLIREIANPEFFRVRKLSMTFHGRDVFAPAAAQLAIRGPAKSFKALGPLVTQIKKISVASVIRRSNKLEGQILYFDRFGNAVTNIHSKDLGENTKHWTIGVNRRKVGKMATHYLGEKDLMAIVNSCDRLEIAYPMGSARERGCLKIGDRVWAEMGDDK